MLRKFFSRSLATLAASSLLGCDSQTDARPYCYSGKIVATTCMNGVLIDVTPAHRIGAKAVAGGANKGAVLGYNVISVSNSPELLSLIYGNSTNQTTVLAPRLYFTVTKATTPIGLNCFANNGIEGEVPSFELRNVSTSACEITAQ